MAPRNQKAKPENGYPQEPEPNKGLGHEEINYLDLSKEEIFKQYREIEAALNLRKKYDFDLFKASTVTEKEFNKKTGKVDDVVVGIRLNDAKPIQRTRMTGLQARELNAHVDHTLGSKYLLLSKTQKEETTFI